MLRRSDRAAAQRARLCRVGCAVWGVGCGVWGVPGANDFLTPLEVEWGEEIYGQAALAHAAHPKLFPFRV